MIRPLPNERPPLTSLQRDLEPIMRGEFVPRQILPDYVWIIWVPESNFAVSGEIDELAHGCYGGFLRLAGVVC